jgi:hypothetical protein
VLRNLIAAANIIRSNTFIAGFHPLSAVKLLILLKSVPQVAPGGTFLPTLSLAGRLAACRGRWSANRHMEAIER